MHSELNIVVQYNEANFLTKRLVSVLGLRW